MDKSLLKISGIIAIVFGVLGCLTLVGAIVGVPLIIGGAKIKEYADYTDEQIIANKDKILIWTIVFLFFCQISGILLLIFYIDSIGKYFQVGGIGYVSGDEAGGSFLARRTIQTVFNACFRFGGETSLVEDVFKMYEIKSKYELPDAILLGNVDSTYLIKALLFYFLG